MEKWVIYLVVFMFILYLSSTESFSVIRSYATFDDSVNVASETTTGVIDDVTTSADVSLGTDMGDTSQLQQQSLQITGPQLFYPTNSYLSFELAAPQTPSGHWPPGIEWGAEYFVFAYDYTNSNSFIFGFGDAFSNRWSGLRRILPVSQGYSPFRLAAFGNRVAYEYFLYPSEAVLGREAGVDGLVGTGDDRAVPIAFFANSAVYTPVDLVRNAALYIGAVAGSPLLYHSFGNDFLAGTADDSGEVITMAPAGTSIGVGTSNSKISYYLASNYLSLILAGPGLNGIFEGDRGGGDDETLTFGGGGGVWPRGADIAYDASHVLLAFDVGALPPYTRVLNLYDLRPVGGQLGRLTSYPTPNLLAGRLVPTPPPNSFGPPSFIAYAIDGAFTTVTGTSVAGSYAIVAIFNLTNGGTATVIEVRDTGADGRFFTTDDFIKQYTVQSPDGIYAVDIKGRVLVFLGTIGGQSGLFVYPLR